MSDFNKTEMGVACPHCGNELVLNSPVPHNVEIYGKSAVGTTQCCGKAVRVHRVVSFSISPYTGDETSDDWGVPFNK